MVAAEADLVTARRGLERPDKFSPQTVIQLACLAMEGFLEARLSRDRIAAGGYSLGHRIRALARVVEVPPALAASVTLLGAAQSPCGIWDGVPPVGPEEAAHAVRLAEEVAALTAADNRRSGT